MLLHNFNLQSFVSFPPLLSLFDQINRWTNEDIDCIDECHQGIKRLDLKEVWFMKRYISLEVGFIHQAILSVIVMVLKMV